MSQKGVLILLAAALLLGGTLVAAGVQLPLFASTTYRYDYEYQGSFFGDWRNGVSGGSKVTDTSLTFDRSYDHVADIRFTAEMTGSKTMRRGAVEAHFGALPGVTQEFTLNGGVSVVVPKGHHYTVRYRPVISVYQVTEYTYRAGLNGETRLAETKECTVAVFDRWNFGMIETNDIGV